MTKSEIIAATVILAFLTVIMFFILSILIPQARNILHKSYDIIKKDIKEIVEMQNQVEDANKKINNKLNTIEIDLNNIKNNIPRITTVTVTFYCPPAKGINSDSDHTKTATMTKPISGYTIAISKSLFEKGWLGCKVYVEGLGVFKIEDRMSKSIKGDCIDICIGTHKEAMKKGKLRNITMVKL